MEKFLPQSAQRTQRKNNRVTQKIFINGRQTFCKKQIGVCVLICESQFNPCLSVVRFCFGFFSFAFKASPLSLTGLSDVTEVSQPRKPIWEKWFCAATKDCPTKLHLNGFSGKCFQGLEWLMENRFEP